eukprot:m.193174 g.193174  ORF g.193174 m.193174 type:complete len:104 (+) comp21756_c1_seq2:1511-1822(+)
MHTLFSYVILVLPKTIHSVCQAWLKAESECNDVLEKDAQNSKALFRRATALEQQNKLEEAARDLEACLKVEEDAAVSKALDRVKLRITRQKEQEKKMYAKMFK